VAIVLITSSITTVMAWASLKMNNFGKFKFYHACTILLACCFVGIKSYEYHDKFTHYSIKLADGNIADGHLVEKSKDFNLEQKTGDIVIHGHKVDLNNKQGEELQKELKKIYDIRSPEGRELAAALVTAPGTSKHLRLAAIEAVSTIRPRETAELLADLADSDDKEIAEAAGEAVSLAEGPWSDGFEDEFENEDDEPRRGRRETIH